jgi:hypothetical protein
MMNFDVFISYPHQDKATADAACATLEAAGIRCWIAPRDVAPGAEWAASIVDAIDRCRVMVLIFSSAANQSKQIHREVQRAFDREVPVVPFRIENIIPEKSLAYYMGPVHWLDALTPPVEQHLQKLLVSIKALVQADIAKPTNEAAATGNFIGRNAEGLGLQDDKVTEQGSETRRAGETTREEDRQLDTETDDTEAGPESEAAIVASDTGIGDQTAAQPATKGLAQPDHLWRSLATGRARVAIAAIASMIIVVPAAYLIYQFVYSPAERPASCIQGYSQIAQAARVHYRVPSEDSFYYKEPTDSGSYCEVELIIQGRRIPGKNEYQSAKTLGRVRYTRSGTWLKPSFNIIGWFDA